jgi:DUF4097 and DUF4098 domain-containing protein YvlB
MVHGFHMSRRGGALVSWSLVLGSLAISSSCVDINAANFQYLEHEERRFAVETAPDVTLDTFDGSIDVESWDRPEVLIVVEKRGRDRQVTSGMRIEWDQQGERVSVKVRSNPREHADFFFGENRSARLIVTVPRNARINAKSGDGRIEIRRVTGGVAVHTNDGSIRLYDVDGEVDAMTDDGSIRVDGIISQLRARSDDGSVRIRAQAGSVAEGDWTIATDDGSIVVELPEDFSAELDAHTGDGRIIVRNLDFERGDHNRWKDTVRGRLGKGGRLVNVESHDGSITLRSF